MSMHRNEVIDIIVYLPTTWRSEVMIQMEAERRRREAGVKQSMEIRVRSCMCVGMYGIWNYLANQGT